MTDQPSITQSVKIHFRDLSNLLAGMTSPRSGGKPDPALVADQMPRLLRTVQTLEEKINTVFHLRQNQLEALMGVGHLINSSLGLKQVLEGVMDSVGVAGAVVCGVSYGGLVALRAAAARPARIEKLVLVSTPAPTWRLDERLERYSSSPRASAPGFVLGAPRRLWREIGTAMPGPITRSRAMAGYLATVCRHPASPVRMARRLRCIAGQDFVADARAVRAPTLVLTGEELLDRVVPVSGTRQYLDLIPNAVWRTLENTGHIGLVTKSNEFAKEIRDFVIS